MRPIYWLGTVLSLITLQTSLSPVWMIRGTVPDLLLVAVIMIAMHWPEDDEPLYFAAALGYLKDVYSGGVMGISLLVFFSLAYFIRREKHRFDFGSPPMFILVVAGSTVLEGGLAFMLHRLAVPWQVSWWLMAADIASRAVYNLGLAGVAVFVYRLAADRYQVFSARRGRSGIVF
jgi:rod shape-determining protein MreD